MGLLDLLASPRQSPFPTSNYYYGSHDAVLPKQFVLNCAAPHDRTQLSKET